MLGGAANAAPVVTDYVVNEAGSARNNVPITFGQVFKAGDVPKGGGIAATLGDRPVVLQVDSKATNPDGSLRHAVVSLIVPSLPGGAKLPLALSTDSAPAGSSTALTLAALLATGYDAKASLALTDGSTVTADVRPLLEAAARNGACKPWGGQCNLWLSGSLVSEWVVNGPVVATNGTANPNLRVYFAVRAYVGTTPGTIGKVRTDIIVENTNAFAPQAQPQYTATLTSGSASYTSPALTQYTATRWHKALWWNNADSGAYLRQDTQYIQATKAISRYMSLTPDARFLSTLRQSCEPLDHCDQTKTMSNVGAQAAIGPLPRWTSVYVVDPDVRAYRWMLANTDALGAYSIHYRDPATGWPVSIRKHPFVTVANWAFANRVAGSGDAAGTQYRKDLLPGCRESAIIKQCPKAWYATGNPNKWNAAHEPAQSYVPYMVTGDYYYMSELAFGASINEIWPNETYRGHANMLIGNAYGPVRAKAWVLRNLADAAWLLPDAYPLKAELTTDVERSLAEWNADYTRNADVNPLHVMRKGTVYDVHNGKHNGMAPWQHNFLTWAVGHVADLGFSGATTFRHWLASFEVGLMTDWQRDPVRGYCWLEASAYKIQVKGVDGNWLPSYAAVYAATFPPLVGLRCNSPEMVSAMGKTTRQSLQVGQMSGFAYSATGYPANFQIGLASAADSGLPKAHEAWALFESRSVKPKPPRGYNDYPNFAVLPRSTPR